MPVATFVHERVMDLIAAACGKNRATMRMANLVPATAMPFTSLTGHMYDSGDYPEALSMALDAIGYTDFASERERAAARGTATWHRLRLLRRIHCGQLTCLRRARHAGIPGFDSAYVALRSDGLVHLWTTLPAIGQGTETTFAQVAADALGIPYAAVIVHKVDTSVGNLEGTGVFSSRSAMAGGGAIISACGELRRRMLADAAERARGACGRSRTGR